MGERRPPDEPVAGRGGTTGPGGEDPAGTLVHKLTVLRDALTREMQSVWAAEGRVYDMGKKLERMRDQLGAVQRELDTQRARTEAAEQRAAEAEDLLEGRHPAGMSEELAAVFRETEEAVARIVEGSRRSAEADRSSLDAEVADLTAWRDRVEPHVRPLREAVADAQREAELVNALIAEALEPVTAALAVLETRLGAFLEVAGEAPDDVVVDISAEDRAPSSPRGA